MLTRFGGAGACLTLSHLTGNSMYDSLGSIVIGLSLGMVALALIRKNRDLLVGSAVSHLDRPSHEVGSEERKRGGRVSRGASLRTTAGLSCASGPALVAGCLRAGG